MLRFFLPADVAISLPYKVAKIPIFCKQLIIAFYAKKETVGIIEHEIVLRKLISNVTSLEERVYASMSFWGLLLGM